MASSSSDRISSQRLFLLGLLPLLLAVEGDGPRAAVGGGPGAAAERRPLPGGAAAELSLGRNGGLALSSTETLVPMLGGGARRVVSLSPTRWLDPLGAWQSVDASFAATASGFVTESDSLSCSFPARCDAPFSVLPTGGGLRLSWTAGSMEIRRVGGARIVLAPKPEAVPGRQQPDGSLLYSSVWPGVSERYRLGAGLVKHEVVIEQLPPAGPSDELILSWTLRVDAGPNVRTRLPSLHDEQRIEADVSGGFRVVDSSGLPRLWLPPPFLVEDLDAHRLDLQAGLPGLPSFDDPADEERAAPLPLAWRSSEVPGGLRIELVVPVSALMARAGSLPIVIDPTVVDLQSPAGVLTVYGAKTFDLLGDKRGLAAGDFNGDGQLDLVVGAHRGNGPGGTRTDSGELHLLFGPLGEGTRDLATDKGDVTIFGADRFDTLGWSVAAGDLNGDGIDDLLVGIPFADGPDNLRSAAGEAQVILGPFRSGEVRDLALLPGDAILHGADRSHGIGYAVAIGDLSGDGHADAIVSALRSDGPLDSRKTAGAVHVMAGPFLPGPARRVVDLALAPADVTIHGESAGDQLGAALAVGDLDGDGIADLAVSSLSSDGRDDARVQAGEVLILLGPLAVGSSVDLALQSADAIVFGAQSGDLFGHDLAIGDLSGDGVLDLVAGAHLSDGPTGARERAGSVAVLFGPFAAGLVRDLASGDADVLVHGANAVDLAGWSVDAGDVSGDGQADLLFGAVAADGPADSRPGAGELHALFGSFSSGTVIDLALTQSDIEVQGAQSSDQLGHSVRIADLTGDGVGDLIAAAKTARGPGESRVACGEAVMVQGRATGCRSDADCSDELDCSLDTCDPMSGECSFDEAPCNTPPTCDVGADRSSACRELALGGVSVSDAEGDSLDYVWVSSDQGVTIFPASGSLPAGEGSRLIPPAVVTLEGGAPPCGRAAKLSLSVSDGRGGVTNCELRVEFADLEPPTLLGLPSNAVVDCDAVPPPADVVASDGCDSAPRLSSSERRIDGACPGEYRLERTWRALDACGNESEATQVIEVVDRLSPSVQSGAERLHCLWPPNHLMVHFSKLDFAPSIADTCEGPLTWRFVDCASNQPNDGRGDGSTEPDCLVDIDGQGFSVRAERSGNSLEQRRYQVTIVAEDACGNPSEPTDIGHVAVSHDRGLKVRADDCESASRR